jgi:hypothetical protein
LGVQLPNTRLKLTAPRFLRKSSVCERSNSAPQLRRTPLGCNKLILTEAPTRVSGHRLPVRRPRAYVQWVERASNDSRATVRRMLELPIDPKVTALWEIELLKRYGKWHASLRGTKPKFMRDFASTQLLFELGAPGQIRPVEPS